MELTFEKDDLLYALQVLQGVTGAECLTYPLNVLIRAEDSRYLYRLHLKARRG